MKHCVAVFYDNSQCILVLIFVFFSFFDIILQQDCTDDLGMENGYIADEFVTASSALRVNNEPWLARLHNQLGEGAWCAGVKENIFLS